jgi:hypothetical protein
MEEKMAWRRYLQAQVAKMDRKTLLSLFIILLSLAALTVVFVSLPMAGGDDWETFRGASQRVLRGEPLYGEKVTHGYYSNPPWVAVLLIPLSLLPHKWGWAILSVASFLLLSVLARRYSFDRWKMIFLLSSPATVYLVLHGEIDVIVLSGLLLPRETWILVALTKPQVAGGLLLGIRRELLIKAAVLLVSVLLLSFLAFGFWPQTWLRQPTPFIDAPHNLWLGLWPFQVPAGLAMLLYGFRRKDERFLVAASPFLSPYAASSSLIGPWLALLSILKTRESLLVWMAWWGALFYRLLGGDRLLL